MEDESVAILTPSIGHVINMIQNGGQDFMIGFLQPSRTSLTSTFTPTLQTHPGSWPSFHFYSAIVFMAAMLTNSFSNPLVSQRALNDVPINVHRFNTANTHLINQVISDTFHMP